METEEMERRAREANAKFEAFFSRYPSPADQHVREGAPLIDLLTDLGQLAGVVEQAGLAVARLDGLRSKSLEAREPVDRYACHLQRLRRFVQELAPRLEARRDQLSHVAVHFRRAMDWSRALSMTGAERSEKE